MENNREQNSFSYTYSAKQQEEIRNIRKKYAPPEEDKMEQLRRLDAGVTKKANGISILMGVLGVLILGLGMSLIMTDIGTALHLGPRAGMFAGVFIGIVGMGVLALAYPVYLRVVKREREKIAPEVLRLTDELMK